MRKSILFAMLSGMLVLFAVPAAQASVTLPQQHDGTECRTVHEPGSSTTGQICVMVNTSDITAGLEGQALLTFSSSKNLESVFVTHLNFLDNGQVVRSVTNENKNFNGTSNYISTSFFYNGAQSQTGQADSYNACMWWTNGAGICISSWFDSAVVSWG